MTEEESKLFFKLAALDEENPHGAETCYQAFKARLMAEGFQSVVYEGEKS